MLSAYQAAFASFDGPSMPAMGAGQELRLSRYAPRSTV